MKKTVITLLFCFLLLGCSSKMKVHNISFRYDGSLVKVEETNEDVKTEKYNVFADGKDMINITYTNDLNTVYVMMAEAGVYEDAYFSRVATLPCASYYEEDNTLHLVLYKDFGNDRYELYRFDFSRDFLYENINEFVTSIEYNG